MHVDNNNRFQALRNGGGDSVGVQNDPAPLQDLQGAPSKPRFDDPGNVSKLGFGTMLKVKFQALKTAIQNNEIGLYQGLKEEAKIQIRSERLNRHDQNVAGKEKLASLDDRKGGLIRDMQKPSFEKYSLQVAKMIEESKVDGKFDPRHLETKLTDLIKGNKFTYFNNVNVTLLQRASVTFGEQGLVDPTRLQKKEATDVFLSVIAKFQDKQNTLTMFLDSARSKIREGAGDVQKFLRNDADAAPLCFIAGSHGGRVVSEVCKQIGTDLGAMTKDLNKSMTDARTRPNGEVEKFNNKSENITKQEGTAVVNFTSGVIAKLDNLTPDPALGNFLKQMCVQIREANPDPKIANAMINLLYVDQLILRNVASSIFESVNANGNDKVGTMVVDLIQMCANGLSDSTLAKKVNSTEYREILSERGPKIVSDMNDILVGVFGMPPEAHVDYAPDQGGTLNDMTPEQTQDLVQNLVGNLPRMPNLQPPVNNPPVDNAPVNNRQNNPEIENDHDDQTINEEDDFETEDDIDDELDEMDSLSRQIEMERTNQVKTKKTDN